MARYNADDWFDEQGQPLCEDGPWAPGWETRCEGELTLAAKLRISYLEQALQSTAVKCQVLGDSNLDLRAALRPFAHKDLCKLAPSNQDGLESVVYGRNNATLRIGDFQTARDVLQQEGEAV